MILIGPWITVFRWDTGTIHTRYILDATDRHKMYDFKRDILLNVLNVHIAT